MDRVFLDANVLFSAAYRHGAGVARLWAMPGVRLMTSVYAAEEAHRNLDTAERRVRLRTRLRAVRIVGRHRPTIIPSGTVLPAKDAPILAAAISARCDYLLTGDRKHFGGYYGKRIGGVLIIPPAEYPRFRTHGEAGR